MDEEIKQTWDTELYNEKHSYVYKYGEDLLNLLEPKKGEKILDLGCGTGQLTNLIASSGADVSGLDMSPNMINIAKKNYPSLNFITADATNFNFDETFDSVFSNAVLHWIKEKEKVVKCVYNSLKKGGRFVAEFGGKNNINRVQKALKDELKKSGFTQNAMLDIWFYPSVAEYTALLENAGFIVNYVRYFKRDTFLNEGDNISDWLEMFAKSFFNGVNDSEKIKIIERVQDRLSKTNFKDGKWFIDYVRLRFIATKK